MRAWLLALACVGCTSLGEDAVVFDRIPDAGNFDAIALGPTLRSINENIFRKRCTRQCHSGTDAAGNMHLELDPFTILVNVHAEGVDCGPTSYVRVVPGDPDHSLLYLKLQAKVQGLINAVCGDPMPQSDMYLPITQAQLDAVHDWILAGAPPDPPR
jgi:hypothetical protein